MLLYELEWPKIHNNSKLLTIAFIIALTIITLTKIIIIFAIITKINYKNSPLNTFSCTKLKQFSFDNFTVLSEIGRLF